MDNQIKHYIRINENKHIIHGFSTAFEQSLELDICITEEGGRHFELSYIVDGELVKEVNPSLKDENGICRFKQHYNKPTLRTEEEKQPELDLILAIPIPPTENEKIWDAITYLINDGYTI